MTGWGLVLGGGLLLSLSSLADGPGATVTASYQAAWTALVTSARGSEVRSTTPYRAVTLERGRVLCLTLRGWAGFPPVRGVAFEVLYN